MSKKIYIIALLLLFTLPLSAEKVKIAVIQFTPENIAETFITPRDVTTFTDRLRTELGNVGVYEVIEREAMEKILDEQEFDYLECDSTDCAIEIGKIVGAGRIVVGKISNIDQLHTVSAFMIDVQSGKILRQHSEDCDCRFQKFLRESIPQVANALSVIKEPVLHEEKRFSWTATDPPSDSYEISISLMEDMSSVVWSQTIQELKTSPPDDVFDWGSTYYWKIQGFDSDGNPFGVPSNIALFVIERVEPPDLISPGNGEQVTTLKPAFSWSPVTEATHYEISLSEEEEMTTVVWNDVTTDLRLVFPNDTSQLERGNTYYWKVVPLDENGEPNDIAVSEVFTFFISLPVEPPELITPGNNEQALTLTPAFSWSPVTEAAQYEVSLSDDNSMAPLLWTEVLSETSKTYPADAIPLQRGRNYYWRVQSQDSHGESIGEPSRVSSFLMPPSIQPPDLISPGNGEKVTTLTPVYLWSSVLEADQFEISLSKDKSMTPVIWNAVIGDTTITYPDDAPVLERDKTYYWKVMPFDQNDQLMESAASTVFSVLMPSLVEPPDLISPGNGEQINTLAPEFSWSSVKTVAQYEFSIYEDEELSLGLWSFETGETNITYPINAVSLKRGPNYYWRVIPLDSEGNKFDQGMSIVSSFSIKEIPKLKQRKKKLEKPSERPVSVVNKVIGDLAKDRVANPGWKTAAWGDQLFNKDKVKTGDDSFASIMFLDRTQMKIRENTVFTIEAERTSKNSLNTNLKVDKGDMWMKVPETGSSFRIETPTSVASVKGTEFSLLVEEDGTTHLTVIEGSVEFMNEMGRILVEEMTTSISALDSPPSPPAKVEKKTIKELKAKVDVKEEFKLKLSESKPGAKEVGTEYNFNVEYLNIKSNAIVQTFKGEVTAKGSEGLELSSDGGSSWADEIAVTLDKGKGIFKGKGMTQGKKTISVTAPKVSPPRLEFDMKQSKETVARINTKATKALEKVDPDIVSKIGNKKMKGGTVSQGAGNVEDVLEKVDSGEYEVMAQEVIENPDGSIRIIMRVKRSSSKGAKGG